MSKIPKGWLTLLPMGELISGTQFIAFKVPLSNDLCSRLPSNEKFTPSILKMQLPNLGLIIDLTNTNRYYDKKEFANSGIRYVKIKSPGQIIPPSSVVNKFIKTVDAYNKISPDKCIGVHCTHGINRTGYLICRYMISRLHIDPYEAVRAFQEGRGIDMYRENYVNDLYKRQPDDACEQTSTSKQNKVPSATTSKSSFQPPSFKHSPSTVPPDQPNYSQRYPHFTEKRKQNHSHNDYKNKWRNNSQYGNGNNWRNNSQYGNGNYWRNNSQYGNGNNWRNDSQYDNGNNWDNYSQHNHQYNPLYNEEYNPRYRPRYNGQRNAQFPMRPSMRGRPSRDTRYSYAKPNNGV